MHFSCFHSLDFSTGWGKKRTALLGAQLPHASPVGGLPPPLLPLHLCVRVELISCEVEARACQACRHIPACIRRSMPL